MENEPKLLEHFRSSLRDAFDENQKSRLKNDVDAEDDDQDFQLESLEEIEIDYEAFKHKRLNPSSNNNSDSNEIYETLEHIIKFLAIKQKYRIEKFIYNQRHILTSHMFSKMITNDEEEI